MEKTSCKLPLICIRRHPNETSELISQMLYGESCTVLETEKDYSKISMDFDATEGWVVSSSLKKEGNSVRSVIQTPFSFVQTKEGRYLLSMGAEIGAGSPVPPLPATPESVVETAQSFLNAPYLYGGRSFFGIDAPALAQLVYKIHGIALPRFAEGQSECGEALNFLEECVGGEVAFFENENGDIIHAGIMLGGQKIIHSFGKVRIDDIDTIGIFNGELNKHTHRLRFIKSILL